MAGIAGEALGDAYVNIMGETAGLAASLSKAKMMASGFVSGMGKTIVGGVGAAFLAAGGAVIYSMKSFMEAETVSNKLAGAIALAGGSADTLMPKYSKLADEMAKVTKWDDEAVKSAMASALARGLSTKKMEEAIPAAAGLAARMGMDLGSAMNMVTRAGMGNTMMLQRYFPQLKSATTATEKWAMVLKLGGAGMEMAKGEVNTLSGAFGQMRKAIAEVFESLGTGFFGGGQLKSLLQKAVDWVWKVKESLDKLVAGGHFQAWIGTAMNLFRSADLGQIIWLSIKIGLTNALNFIIKLSKTIVDILTIAFQQGLLAWVGLISSATYWKGVGQVVLGSFLGIGGALLKVFTTPLDYLEAGITWILEKLWEGLGRFGPGGAGFEARGYDEIFKETQASGTFRGDATGSAAMSQNLLGKGLANIASVVAGPLKDFTAEIVAKWETAMGEQGLFSTDEDKAKLKELFDPLREVAVAQQTKYDKTIAPPPGEDLAEKTKSSVISMVDIWKEMQKSVSEKKMEDIAKDQLTEQEKANGFLNTIALGVGWGPGPIYGSAGA